MPENEISSEKAINAWQWVGWRLLKIFMLLLLLSMAVTALGFVIDKTAAGISISFAILFVLPYGLGGLAAILINPAGKKTGTTLSVSIGMIMLVLVLGGLLFREGIICIVLLAPLWLLGAFLGALTVERAHKKLSEKYKVGEVFSCSFFAALPFLFLIFGSGLGQSAKTYTVTRTVDLSVSAEAVWPHLLELSALTDAEGRWNIAQNMLQIPRPRSAHVEGTGPGAVRYARWGEQISFEEHITDWRENERLGWTFAFPNDSVHQYTDRHISPDGNHLKILRGQYQLTPLGSGQTRLTLTTDYEANTPVNAYSALWGELILGDIQSNILTIIEGRVQPKTRGLNPN